MWFFFFFQRYLRRKKQLEVAILWLPRILERKATFNIYQKVFLQCCPNIVSCFFLFSWLKLSKSLAQLVTVTSLKKLSFVCPKTSSSEACFHRMSEPQLSQCQHMNLGDLRFSISFCIVYKLVWNIMLSLSISIFLHHAYLVRTLRVS